MGMDSVELVMAFEEEFRISIPDSAAEKMRTPRDVIQFVIEERRRVAQLDVEAHVGQALAAMDIVLVKREATFNELFQHRKCVARWKELGERLAPFSIPPARARGPGGPTAGIAFLLSVVFLFLGQWALAGACAVIFATGWMLMRRSTAIPEVTSTVQKLMDHLTRPIPEQDISERVKAIVIRQLGLKEAAYGEDKRFVEDLGMD